MLFLLSYGFFSFIRSDSTRSGTPGTGMRGEGRASIEEISHVPKIRSSGPCNRSYGFHRQACCYPAPGCRATRGDCGQTPCWTDGRAASRRNIWRDSRQSLEVVEADLANPAVIQSEITRLGSTIHTVIHCAGETSFLAGERQSARSVQIDGPLALPTMLRDRGLRCWVQAEDPLRDFRQRSRSA